MKQKPIDPETFITEETIGWQTPSPTIEKRIDEAAGKHTFELCMLHTYRLTKKFLLNQPEIDESEKQKHLYAIKAEILHYCIPSNIDWKKYLNGDEHGYLILKPNSKSDIYYRFLAYNLFLLEPWKCSRFLDFHLVHCVLNPSREKTNSLVKLKVDFLQHLDYQVTYQISDTMALRRDAIFNELISWNRKQMDLFTMEELTKYYEYKFDPKTGRNIHRIASTQSQAKYAGCDETLLIKYFELLLNPKHKGGSPFMPKNSIEFLLCNWFGVGNPQNESELFVNITLEQLVYFLREFVHNFQIHKSPDRKKISQKELINLAYKFLPGVFGENSATTVYKRFTDFSEAGYTPSLDWRKNEELRKAIGK